MLSDSTTGRCLEIEITPEMVSAGTNYIIHSLALIEPIISSEDEMSEFACSLFRAMAGAGGVPKYRS